MAQLIKHYMVKKQSTWYLWQVSLMAASAWPSPRGLHVSHSPASPNWNRTIATTEYMQREETLTTYFIQSLRVPSVHPWYSWLTWDWVFLLANSVTAPLWVFHTALFICAADHQTQGLSEGSLYQSEPQCWAFLLPGPWLLLEIGLWCSPWQCIRAKQQVTIIYLPLCDLWM